MNVEAFGFGLLHVDQTQKIYKLKSGDEVSFNMDRMPEEDCESIYYRNEESGYKSSNEQLVEEGTENYESEEED